MYYQVLLCRERFNGTKEYHEFKINNADDLLILLESFIKFKYTSVIDVQELN